MVAMRFVVAVAVLACCATGVAQDGKEWTPSREDIVKLGAQLNIVVAGVKGPSQLLIDSAEMKSAPHAEYAQEVMLAFSPSAALGRAVEIVSFWPASKTKTDAKAVIAGYAKAYAAIARAVASMRAIDYSAAGEEMMQAGKHLSSTLTAQVDLFSSVGVSGWERELKSQIPLFDREAKIAHAADCAKVTDLRSADEKKWESAFATEVGKLTKKQAAAVAAWGKKPQGMRGQIGVTLPESYLLACRPTFAFRFVPIDKSELLQRERCSCMK